MREATGRIAEVVPSRSVGLLWEHLCYSEFARFVLRAAAKSFAKTIALLTMTSFLQRTDCDVSLQCDCSTRWDILNSGAVTIDLLASNLGQDPVDDDRSHEMAVRETRRGWENDDLPVLVDRQRRASRRRPAALPQQRAGPTPHRQRSRSTAPPPQRLATRSHHRRHIVPHRLTILPPVLDQRQRLRMVNCG